MGTRSRELPLPAYVATLGDMIAHELRVRALCTAPGCPAVDVDLIALAALRGDTFSLVGRRCRCRIVVDCTGWNRFYYLAGVYRPLWTYADVERWTEADRPNWCSHPESGR